MWTCYELLLGYFIRCPPFAYNVYYTCVKCGIFVTLILQTFSPFFPFILRHTGYDMNAYSNMYGQSASMGSYSQTASSYGPNRGYGGGGGGGDAGRGDKDGRGGAAKYHPYRRY